MDDKISIINNEYDYSNCIITVECVLYLVKYLDSVYRNFLNLIKEDEKKNEHIKYEYKSYNYKKNFGEKFEVYIKEKNHNYITCNNLESFESAVKTGNLKNISGMKITLNINFKRGKSETFEDYENSFIISLEPYETIFRRKSNHNEEDMNQIENNINDILNKFPTVNTIFCTK